MSGGRPRKHLPDEMPLSERPSFLAVLPVFQKHADKFGVDYLALWGRSKGPASMARRAIALELSGMGYGPRVIAWALGWRIEHACRLVKRSKAETVATPPADDPFAPLFAEE